MVNVPLASVLILVYARGMSDQSPQPTAQDIENATIRAEIAAKQNAAYRQVMAWADRIMGPGWYPSGRHFLVEKSEEDQARKEGRPPQAAATVYTVTNGVSKRHFVLRDGQPVEVADYKEGFGKRLLELELTRTIEVRGEPVHPHRYSLCWAGYELYEPSSAERLAALRKSRERKRGERAEQRFREENPLLAWAESIKAPEEAKQEHGRGG